MPGLLDGSRDRKKATIRGNTFVGDPTITIDQRGNAGPSGVTGESAFGLTELGKAPELPEKYAPSRLLAARHELMGYIGRRHVLSELTRWLAGDAVKAAKLITGTGGQGKTRLALEVARHAQKHRYLVLIAHHKDDGGLTGPVVDIPALRKRQRVMVVVDYADRWPYGDLRGLFEQLSPNRHRHLRVLMLARSDHFWNELKGALRDFDTSAHLLEPLEDNAEGRNEREELFDKAVTVFADHLEVDVGRLPRPATLHSSAFGLMLAVQMAALVSVLTVREQAGSRREELASDPAAASRYLIGQEVRHWRLMSRAGFVSDKLMARAVMIATLTRGLEYDQARALLDAIGIGGDAQQVLNDHRICYPPSARGVLEPLFPDRLGEDFVAAVLGAAVPDRVTSESLRGLDDLEAPGILKRLLAQPGAERLLPGDGSIVRWPPSLMRSVMTELIEVSLRWEYVAGKHLFDAISRNPFLVLAAGSTALSRLCKVRGADAVLPDVGAALDRVIGEGVNMDLDAGAALVAECLAGPEYFRHDLARRAQSLRTLSIRRMAVGDRERALKSARDAVSLSEQAAVTGSRDGAAAAAQSAGLASALTNLANVLSEVGQYDDALAPAQQAVDLYRQLSDQGGEPNQYLPGLGAALTNLGKLHSDRGRPEDALEPDQAAVVIYRKLLGSDTRSVLALASALTNLVRPLSELGQAEQARDAAEEAARLAGLAADPQTGDPDAARPALARSLANLGSCLSDLGRHADALGPAQEAVEHYREMANVDTGNPAAYRRDLAISLTSLTRQLAELDRCEEALAPARDAVTAYRQLTEAGEGSDAFLPSLAASLANLGVVLHGAGRDGEAVEATRQAVGIYRTLADSGGENTPAALSEFAGSLEDLVTLLSEANQPVQALDAAKELVFVYGRLAEPGIGDPDEYLPKLAVSLRDVTVRLARQGQPEDALRNAQQAVAFYRDLLGRTGGSSAGRRADLAALLNELAARASELNRAKELREAVEILEMLAGGPTRDLAVYRPILAAALQDLGVLLRGTDQHKEAAQRTRQAVEIRRDLAASGEVNRAAALSALADSLSNLVILLSTSDRAAEALESSRELADVYGRLAEPDIGDPDEYLPRLAASLQDVTARLAHQGRPEDALRNAQKGASLYRDLLDRVGGGLAQQQADLATLLNEAAARASELDRAEEALPSAQAAADILQMVAVREPAVYLPDLASSLHRLAALLFELHERDDALAAADRALHIRRELAAAVTDNRERHLPDLATSLMTRAIILQGRNVEAAIAAIAESVGYWAALEKTSGGKYRERLKSSSATWAKLLDRTGRHDEAARIRLTFGAG